jgi:exodeoxyribonuclease V gamma subunit
MAGLRLFTSNRLEILAETLAEVLRTPLPSPLDREVLVVQSRGMERWLSLELARHHGVCANYRFPFPNAFVREIYQKVAPDIPDRSPFDPDILSWRIMERLPALIERPGFEDLRIYLGDGEGGIKRFQLSRRIADTFDQYLLFRPDMISRWEKGEDGHWQAQLWRDLVKGHEKRHRAALAEILYETIREASSGLQGLPRRVAVFGISALPRFHVQFLAAISRVTEVNLFLMNPCREYWGDILSRWEIKRRRVREGGRHVIAEDLHIERGNSLLASMGTLGRDFFDMVTELDCEESSSFEDPGEECLLACTQSDILNLRDRQQAPGARKKVSEEDASIQIHACHSPMREMEVLRDRLLHLFEEDPQLLPRDILVMTPAIELYAPYVQAVFDIPSVDPGWIPFSIADRSVRNEGEIIEPLLAILDLWGSRFGATQVITILETGAVQRKFDLSESDVDLVRTWVKETRIRWGINGKTRGDLGLPALEENTWEAGIERLLLGYALPGAGEHMFGGLLPYDHIEGNDALVLGNFAEFTRRLFRFVSSLGRKRTLSEWSGALRVLLDDFFAADEETEREMQVIRGILNDLEEVSFPHLAGFEEAVDIPVIRGHLVHAFERAGYGMGFIAGGVTFCAMVPMRSIPFKVICLVGMDGEAYPRQSKPLGFDLMARHPRPGDRSRRNDDRYLFLETLLSARETLYISYVGQSVQDNSPIPPSVLVSELLDAVEEGFEIPGGNILDHVVTQHRLQAFSPAYFEPGGRIFSYSEANLEAARGLLKGPVPLKPFISRGLSTPEESWKTVDLGDLARFFGNPARFLLQRRLGIYLGEGTSILEEREPFDLKGLEKYALEQDLTARGMAGRAPGDFLDATRASGQLPHGAVGACTFQDLARGINAFVEKLGPYRDERVLEPLDADFEVSRFRVKGGIGPIYPERFLYTRYAGIKARDLITVWIHHLALNIIGADPYPLRSMLAGLEAARGREPAWRAWFFEPVEKGKEILEGLLDIYWEGLMRPLPFFPESSRDYGEDVLVRGRSPEEALVKARSTWRGGDYSRGEGEDPYSQLCFRAIDPLETEFQELALRIFEPLLEHCGKMA